ncbi:MAG: glutathione reductase [Verrucomicrobiaceae bacterium]|nr:glutathione reductase [Verrucomicrobiaceae bacterium]
MSQFQYDLFVIGAGSGGVRASRMAAQYGGRVAIAEDLYLGGTCVNVGCVPKKLLVYASHFSELFRDAGGFGWDVATPLFDWPTLIANKDKEIERLNGVYQRLLEQAGVQLYSGRATLLDAHTVEIDGEKITARNILLATGGWPWIPEIPGCEFAISSNEVFHLPQLPHRVVVVGGGYIAVEFAGIFNGMGAETDLVYRGDLFLREFDREMRLQLADEMREKGVTLRFNQNVAAITKHGDELNVELDDGTQIECDCVLYATGRKPRVKELGLDNIGVTCTDSGHIEVNDYFQTSVPNIYAIGDVIGGIELTPMALAQGMAVAKTLFRGEQSTVEHEHVPTAIFSQPTLASVGYNEEDARALFPDIAVFVSKFKQLKYTLTDNTEKTLLKLIVDCASDKVIGAHMLGQDAGEIIQGLAVAIKAGATKADFDSTLGIHPTVAEEFVTMRTQTR